MNLGRKHRGMSVTARLLLATCLFGFSALAAAAELSGIFLDEEISIAGGPTLVLNGAGLREKLWVDVYAGSLYLPEKSADVAEILSASGHWRIQLDFIYKEVASKKLIASWREGFEKNQSAGKLKQLQTRIDQLYGYFLTSAVAKDQYRFDYFPGKGVQISKNRQPLGLIPGKDFKTALLEIWLGNHPVDKALKKSMLGMQ